MLTNYKTNKPELEVLARQLIEIRRLIVERAKEHEELRQDPAQNDGENELPK